MWKFKLSKLIFHVINIVATQRTLVNNAGWLIKNDNSFCCMSICDGLRDLATNEPRHRNSNPQVKKVAAVAMHPIPVYKDGSKHSPGNCRPILLTSICCKLLEHIIASHIFSHLEWNNFFFQNQHGFCKALSRDSQLLEFMSDLNYGME